MTVLRHPPTVAVTTRLWVALAGVLLTLAAAPAYSVGWVVGAARRAGAFLAEAYVLGRDDGRRGGPGGR